MKVGYAQNTERGIIMNNEMIKKRILAIATGGTIASRKTEEGLVPAMKPDAILEYVPQIEEFCKIDVIQLLNLDSTDMMPPHWLLIAETIEKNYEAYEGFVILHGTDTMAYTAAALSYLIQNINKPIVLTGSQQPVDRDITDARANLVNSFFYASQPDAAGVVVLFDGQVIAGTRARKVRTKSFHAFSSIDFPNLSLVRDGKLIRYIKKEPVQGAPVFYHSLNTGIFVLKLIPGMDAAIFPYLKEHYEAIIIESFGVGGLPSDGNHSFLDAIEDWILSGKTIIMTTQVPHEGSDMEVYRVGNKIKQKYELIEAYDMTLEAVVTKLMWILGVTKEQEEIRKLFYMPINYDIIRYS